MKSLYYLLTIILSFSLVPDLQAQTEKPWTLIVYLVGSDLESGGVNAGTTDMEEMEALSNTSNVHIVVLTGGADKDGWRTPRSWEIVDGVRTETNFVAVDTKMSNPQNLTDFINWSVTNYPGEKYMLTLWNHGMAISGYGWDEVADAQLKVPQIASAIEATDYIQNDNYFELIGFDACLMSTLEVVLSLQNYGEYFVASEEQEPGHGWNYTPIVTAMQNGTVANGEELGIVVVDGFFDQAAVEETNGVTLAVTDLTLVQNLANKLETLVTAVAQSNTAIQTLHRSRANAQEYSKAINDPWNSTDMVDVGDMMKQLKRFDPSFTAQADTVLAALDNAVRYERHDDTRPLSTGLTMFVPHNKLIDDDAVNSAMNDDYIPMDFYTEIEDFVANTYLPIALADDVSPSGTIVEDMMISPGNGEQRLAGEFSGVRVTHDDDLEQVQIILLEEFEGFPDEFLVLGSTTADTSYTEGGDDVFGYFWDELWLGINGYPAYISDIQEYELENGDGEMESFTRVHIPAILNPDENFEGKEIILAYRYDEDFNITMENIVREPYYNGSVLVPGKERIKLVPGDEVVLLYESFNEVTDEEFFVVFTDAVITIENGNEDLMLEYDQLDDGNYHLGYILMDHSQNDTIIFDTRTFTAGTNAVEENFANNNISMYPNPADEAFNLELQEFSGESFSVRIIDINGRIVFSGTFDQQQLAIPTYHLPGGNYGVEITMNNKIITDRIVISH